MWPNSLQLLEVGDYSVLLWCHSRVLTLLYETQQKRCGSYPPFLCSHTLPPSFVSHFTPTNSTQITQVVPIAAALFTLNILHLSVCFVISWTANVEDIVVKCYCFCIVYQLFNLKSKHCACLSSNNASLITQCNTV